MHLNKISFIILVMTVILSPLPFGSNTQWSESTIFIITGLTTLIWAVNVISNHGKMAVSPQRIYYLIIPFILLIILTALQASPFVPNSITHPLWKITADILNTPTQSYISLNPEQTLYGLIRLLNMAAIFWLSLQLCRNANNARRLLAMIAICSVIYAIYGLIIQISGANSILFTEKTAYTDSLTSTFINKNTYATYAAIGIIICLAFAIEKLTDFFKSKPSRRAFERFISEHSTGISIYLISAFIISAALLMTNSRGGIFSAAIGVIILFFISAVSKENKKLRKIIGSLFIAMIVIISLLISNSSLEISKRFENLLAISNQKNADKDSYEFTDFSLISRSAMYQNTLQATNDSPWFGTGLGTFEEVYKQYRGKNFPLWMTSRIDYAHNIYLESMLELGYIGFLLFIAPFLFILLLFIKGIKNRKKNTIFPTIGASVTILIAAHSFVDFSVQIPAVMITYAAILGACCAQSWSTRKSSSRGKPSKIASFTTIAILLAISVGLLSYGTKSVIAASFQIGNKNLLEKKFANDEITPTQLNDFINKQKKSLKWDNSAQTYYQRAIAQVSLAKKYGYSSDESQELVKKAKDNLIKSLTAAPANPYGWNQLAVVNGILHGHGKDVRKALLMSLMTGPYEINLIPYRIGLALKDWDNYTKAGQELFNSQICLGWYGHKWKMAENLTLPSEKKIICQTLPSCNDIDAASFEEKYCE